MKTNKQKSFKKMFTCGTGNFAHMDPDDHDPPTPKSSKKKRNKNPYATRGLDKFSTVLAELEAKREMIMANTESQGVALIRFMYDNSQNWIPIIVRSKVEKKLQAVQTTKKTEINQEEPRVEKKAKEEKKATKKSLSWNWRGECLRWKDSYYCSLVMVLILLCLVMFGRMFAICCTCIWWYMVPSNNIMKERSMVNTKKKEYGRRLSDKRLLGGKIG